MTSPTISRTELERFFSAPAAEAAAEPHAQDRVEELLTGLESGEIRSAIRTDDGRWQAQSWVKTGILVLMRLSELEELPAWPGGAVDKSLVPPRTMSLRDGVRVVPGGTAIRRGAGVMSGAVVMPPSYVNVGAYVGAGTMVDSHVLVGSCAQVGGGVHLSAAVQLGGVLEPIGARPVVVEDNAFIGAQSGLYEGVIVRSGAVLAPGTIITSSTVIYDVVQGRELVGEVPEGAVVVPGSRPARGDFATERGLSLYAPCIVKYRDEGTDAATSLEQALR